MEQIPHAISYTKASPKPHKAGTSSVVHSKVWIEKHLRSLEDIHHGIVSGNDRTPKVSCFCQKKTSVLGYRHFSTTPKKDIA